MSSLITRIIIKNTTNIYVLGFIHDAISELADLSLILQNRCLSIAEANKCILRTIRIFESMIDHHGPKTEEALNARGDE